MPRAPILLFFCCLGLLFPVGKKTVWAGSELGLSPDFRISEMKQMPCPLPHPAMRVESTSYPQESATEWQIRLKPTSQNANQMFENLQSADFTARFPASKEITLFWSKGSHSEISDFQPQRESLQVGKPVTLESFGGRSSDGVMPYFNLITEGGGLIVAIGWPGDWKATFELQNGNAVKIRGGLKKARFKLLAGQEVRIPSILVMSYQGNWLDGQNQFRRLMLRHFTPKNHKPMDLMPVAASVHGMIGFNDTTEENLSKLAKTIASLKLPLDTFWLDAGWNEGGFPKGQGNSKPDRKRFPNGLDPLGRVVKNSGMRFLVWFEPERAMAGTQMDRDHPDWILKPTATPPALRYQEKDGFQLVNLGIKEARDWAIETVSRDLSSAGIAIYRQDFNEYPAYFWHTGETDENLGLREVLYINGLYDFLDELVRRHPGLILDQCASGGRRMDFETMRRSVVLWRSDSCWDDKGYPRNVQAMTHGLSHWIPLHGLGSLKTDDLSLRSGMGACASFPINFQDPRAVEALRTHLDRYLKIRDLFAADYYPLTEWTDHPGKWLAFQFQDPDRGRGIVQAFAGPNQTRNVITLKLRNLEPNQTYLIHNWDHPRSETKRTGVDLMTVGVESSAKGNSQAIVFEYRKEP